MFGDRKEADASKPGKEEKEKTSSGEKREISVRDIEKHQELLARTALLTQNIDSVKSLQWKILYYPLLAMGALVALFQLPYPIKNPIYGFLNVAACVIVGLIAVAALAHLISTVCNLRLYRFSSEAIENELNLYTGIRDKIKENEGLLLADWLKKRGAWYSWVYRVFITREKQERLYSLIFSRAFAAIIVIAAIATTIIIRRDRFL